MPASTVQAAIYLRISFDREMDGLAIDRQLGACSRLAAEREWDVVRTYIDQSKSATDKTRRRPEYDRMVADHRAGEFTVIICWDLDRLTRQPRQLEEWIEAAEVGSLSIVTANGEADLTTDGGRMYARVKAAVARSEVERHSVRRAAAEEQRAHRGQPPRNMRMLGYRASGEVAEHEAAAVRELFRLRAVPGGPSITSLAAALSGESGDRIPATLPHLPRRSHVLAIERNQRRRAAGLAPVSVPADGPWAVSTVVGILRNPRYAGYSVNTGRMDQFDVRRGADARIVRGEEGNLVRGAWTPLVDEATWDAVQLHLDGQSVAGRSKLGKRVQYLGSDFYLCGHCGQRSIAKSGRYRCPGPDEHDSTAGCFTRSSHQIDVYVCRAVREMLDRLDIEGRLLSPRAPRLQEIHAEIAGSRRSVERAVRDYEVGDVLDTDVARRRERQESRIWALKEERRRMLSFVGLGPLIEANDPVGVFDEAGPELQRLVAEALVQVRIFRQAQGRRGLDPATVRVVPRASQQ